MYPRGSVPRPSCSFRHVKCDLHPRRRRSYRRYTEQRSGIVASQTPDIVLVFQSPGGMCGRRAPGSGSASGVDVWRQGADVAQVAVLLGVVQAIADDELVGDVKTHILHVNLDLGCLGLAQQGDDL